MKFARNCVFFVDSPLEIFLVARKISGRIPSKKRNFLHELTHQNIISTPNYFFLVNSPPNGPESQAMYVTNFSNWRAIPRCGEVSRNIPLTGKFLSSERLNISLVWSVHSRDRNHGGKMPYLPGHRR